MQRKITVKLPIADIVNGATRGLAVIAISGYQRFISPHKGFSCAHRVLYGCDSCSQYFKRVIADEGIFKAIAKAKGRFEECREANEILKKRRTKCQTRRKYYASRMIPNAMAIEAGDLGNPEGDDIPEDPNLPEESGDRENQTDQNKKNLGGSQWSSKRRSQADNKTNNQANSNGDGNNNCLDYIDCADCADGINLMDCDRLNCNDLNCDNADCLSGIDCSGLDCSGLDCGGLDCGGCG